MKPVFAALEVKTKKDEDVKLGEVLRIFVTTRPGKVRRFMDEQPLKSDGEYITVRMAAQLPPGFRFRRDEIAKHMRTHNWKHAKAIVIRDHAVHIYLPKAPKKG